MPDNRYTKFLTKAVRVISPGLLSMALLSSALLLPTVNAAGLVFSDGRGVLNFGSDFDDDHTLSQQSLRNDRFARWMNIQSSRDVRRYAMNTSAGNGIDNRLEFRHSQIERYDHEHWNPESLVQSVTEMQWVQRAGGSWLHAAGSFTEAESHYQAGIALGRFFLAGSTGYGTAFSRLGGDQADLDPWFFHGGSRAKFDFSGASLGFSLTDRTRLDFGSWQLDSTGLETRRANLFGFDHQSGLTNFGARVYDIDRGGESIARALQLSASVRNTGIGFRDFHHANGARLTELHLRYNGFKKANIGLSVRQKSNPLFLATEDTQIMFSVSGRMGGRTGSIFAANGSTGAEDEAEEEDPERQSRRVRNSVLIGAGVVAGIAVASSGSDSTDDAQRFPREAGAAFGVAGSINPTCIRENREYGSWIYRNTDGTFSYLPVRRGDTASVNLGSPNEAPSGTVVTAAYHCHGGPDPRYINEEFSPQDIRSANFFNVNGYLSTPGGQLRKYDIRTRNITRIGTVPTS